MYECGFGMHYCANWKTVWVIMHANITAFKFVSQRATMKGNSLTYTMATSKSLLRRWEFMGDWKLILVLISNLYRLKIFAFAYSACRHLILLWSKRGQQPVSFAFANQRVWVLKHVAHGMFCIWCDWKDLTSANSTMNFLGRTTFLFGTTVLDWTSALKFTFVGAHIVQQDDIQQSPYCHHTWIERSADKSWEMSILSLDMSQ